MSEWELKVILGSSLVIVVVVAAIIAAILNKIEMLQTIILQYKALFIAQQFDEAEKVRDARKTVELFSKLDEIRLKLARHMPVYLFKKHLHEGKARIIEGRVLSAWGEVKHAEIS